MIVLWTSNIMRIGADTCPPHLRTSEEKKPCPALSVAGLLYAFGSSCGRLEQQLGLGQQLVTVTKETLNESSYINLEKGGPSYGTCLVSPSSSSFHSVLFVIPLSLCHRATHILSPIYFFFKNSFSITFPCFISVALASKRLEEKIFRTAISSY